MLCYYADYHYAECRILFTVMLNVVMLNVVMLNVVMLSVIILNVVMLIAILVNVVAPLDPQNISALFFQILRDHGFPVDLLPDVVDAGIDAGILVDRWFGVPEGTPVTASMGDLQVNKPVLLLI